MTREIDPPPTDELELEEMLAFDRALAGGDPTPSIDPGSSLRAVHECQRLLEAVWPRTAPLSLELPRRFGRYLIERELGRGAFGVVFLASDTVLGRRVALKVPRPETLVTPEVRRRFLREAEAASRLDHPHIVPVYDVGEVGPVCYIASAYCEGSTLADWLRRNSAAVPLVSAARLVAKLAAAVGHAHERGILHRDLKPSNILLQRLDVRAPLNGEECSAHHCLPRICDFGLARLLDQESHETRSGVPIGSPGYMAPEQAAGRLREHGPATDVYALGVILYELLAGRPPQRGETDLETLRLVTDQEPASPRDFRPGLPRDLETIVLKSLEKRPKDRYPNASELAEDLERFIAGKSVRARPVRPWQLAAKWAKRRPAHAALVVVSTLAILLFFGILSWSGAWLERHNQHLRAAVAWAELDTQRVERAARDAHIEAARAGEREQSVRLAERIALGSQVKLIHETLESGNVALAAKMFEDQEPAPGRPELRGFAWSYLRQLFRPRAIRLGPEHYVGGPSVMQLAISPDSRTLAAGMDDGRVVLWCLGEERVEHTLYHQKSGPGNEIYHLAFSPDGRFLASVDPPDSVKIWDVATGKERAALPAPIQDESTRFDGYFALKFVESADCLVIFRTRAKPRSFDVSFWSVPAPGGQPELKATLTESQLPSLGRAGPAREPSWPRKDERAAPWLAYARQHLVLLDEGRALAIKDGASYATIHGPSHYLPVARIRGPLHIPSLQDRFILDALTPDDSARLSGQARHIVGARDDESRRWLGPHETPAFSPDGRMLAVSISGVGAALIDVASGRIVMTYIPDRRFRALELAFAPDGRSIVIGGFDSQVHVWRLRPNALAGHKKETWSLAFSPDGGSLASASDDGTIKLWHMAGGGERATLKGHDSLVTMVAYSPDGAIVASAGWDKTVRIWDAATGRSLATLRGHTDHVRSLAFAPDGKSLASAGDDHAIRIWDLAHSSELCPPLAGHTGKVYSLVFSADGKTLFSGATDRTIRLWDWPRVRARAVWPADDQVYCLALAPDEQTVASGHEKGTATLWNVATGKARGSLRRHTASVLGLAFSPDGLTLASAGRDKTVRLWDPATGQELLTLNGHMAPVHAATFSPDGAILATGSHDGEIKLWHSKRDGEPRARPK
jgi:eukaryotic-like serine/threonine-protein kinase